MSKREEKIVGIFVMMLLIATALSSVSGNILEQEVVVNEASEKYETTYRNILFSDDDLSIYSSYLNKF